MYDYLIVGAGLFGAVFAQQAKEKGKRVLVIDRVIISQEMYIQRKWKASISTSTVHTFSTPIIKLFGSM